MSRGKVRDQPLTQAKGENLVDGELYRTLEAKSINLFAVAHGHAKRKGMILADTRFEFGFVAGGLILVDAVLKPDSSRFWDGDDWKPGTASPAYDKQYLREWLLKQD